MYAVITSVHVAEGQAEAALQNLKQQVVPMVQRAPGFVAGYWTHDHATNEGHSMVLFESEEHARNQLARIQQMAPDGPGPGVTWGIRAVTEVVVEAHK